jgi:polyhydroxybutyrate depolymerase
VDGRSRRAVVHVPPGPAAGPWPLVLVLHGTGSPAEWMAGETRFPDAAEAAGVIAVFPEGTLPHPDQPHRFRSNPLRWNDGSPVPADDSTASVDDVAFLDTLLDELLRGGGIDASRVYATGFSNGAGMAFRLAAEASHRLAAVAPVAGLAWLGGRVPVRAVPTLYVIGALDPLVPLAGGSVRLPWGLTVDKPPALEPLRDWAVALGCPPQPREVPGVGGARTRVYGPGREGVEVTEVVIAGHGHHWPGGRAGLNPRIAGPFAAGFDANAAVLEFFARHRS